MTTADDVPPTGNADDVPIASTPETTSAPSTARAARLRTVQLEAPSVFAGDHLVRLERLVDDFAALAAVRSLQELGISLEARSLWAHEMPWSDARMFPGHDAVTHLLVTAEGGTLMISIDPALVALMAARLLDTEPDVRNALRPVTATDRAVISRFSDLLDSCLDEMWADASDSSARLEWEGFNSDVEFGADRNDSVLTFAIEIQIFGTYTVIYCVFTESALAPVRARLLRPARRPAPDDEADKRHLQAQIARVPVEVLAHIATLRLSPFQIAALEPGDLVELPGALPDAVTLVVDGVAMRRGSPGEVGHRIVVSLTDEPTR